MRIRKPNPARHAFTLLEVVLVLAVIVIMASLAVPSIEGMWGNYRVAAAADMIRASWATARARAVDEGHAYRFAILPGEGNFRIAPEGSEYWGGGTITVPDSENTTPPLVQEDVLPKGVRFAPMDSVAGGGLDSGGSGVPIGSVAPESWVTILTLLPDGTAKEDVEIAFVSRGTLPLVLRMRGLTGVVTAKTQRGGP